jgi:adenosylhomocysteine nucleosidase
MKTVILISAMRLESRALLEIASGWKREKHGKIPCYRFALGEWNCCLIESGMGMERAREATRMLLDATPAEFLISFGIAGAVGADLKIGDVVVAEKICLLDRKKLSAIQPLAKLSRQAWNAIVLALQKTGAGLYHGSAITTRGSQSIDPGIRVLPHPVLEMETAGILKEAKAHEVPLLVVRAISDGPEAPLPFDLEEMVDDNDHLRIGKILLAILKKPAILGQALKMGRNSQLASRNAAIAVTGILSISNPIKK